MEQQNMLFLRKKKMNYCILKHLCTASYEHFRRRDGKKKGGAKEDIAWIQRASLMQIAKQQVVLYFTFL